MSDFNPLLPDPIDESFGDVERTSNGTTGPYTIGFAFANQSLVAIAGTATVRNSPSLAVYTEDSLGVYTEAAYTFASTNTIMLGTAITNGLKIRIKRISFVSESADIYTGNTPLSADTLNDLRNKTLWSAQEIYARLEALNVKLESVTGAIGGANEYNFTGNGATTAYTLTGESGLTDAQCLVFVDGVRQKTTAYNLSDDELTFTVAPSNGAAISILVLEGVIVTAVVGTNAVDTAQIADGAVTFNKIDFGGAGTNGQFLGMVSGAAAYTNPVPANITGFDTQVRTNHLDQMAAPTGSVSMNSQKITNLATGTSFNDAVNVTQMQTYVASQIPANVTNLKITSGAMTLNSTSYQVVTFGWQADYIELTFDFTPTAGQQTTHYVGTQTQTHVTADGTSVRNMVLPDIASGPIYVGRTINFQLTATGFQLKKAVSGQPNCTVRYKAMKNWP